MALRRACSFPLVVLAVTAALAGCSGQDGEASPGTGAGSEPPVERTASEGCDPLVTHGQPPEWARGGFAPGTSVHYSVGDRGEIAAVLFGHPLHSPPLSGHQSKILWVAREDGATHGTGPDTLHIKARLEGSERTVSREVPGGPGPSLVEMPEPGCWTFTLTWSGHTDTLDVRYQSGD